MIQFSSKGQHAALKKYPRRISSSSVVRSDRVNEHVKLSVEVVSEYVIAAIVQRDCTADSFLVAT